MRDRRRPVPMASQTHPQFHHTIFITEDLTMLDEITAAPAKSKRGFASLSRERRQEIARMGGRSVPKERRAYSQNHELAREAGRKGGQSVPAHKRAFSQNRDLAAESGRKGGSSVPSDRRSFSQNRQLAVEAGRKGGHMHKLTSTETSQAVQA